MANCVNPDCRKPIDTSFDFCPACGADNRPPEKQIGRGPCGVHRFVIGIYCVVCGEPKGEPPGMGHTWRMRVAGLLILGGTLALVFGILVAVGHAFPNTTGGRWVAGWYESPVRHYSRYGYRSYSSPLGYEIEFSAIFGGIVALIYGVLMLKKVQFNSGSTGGGLWSQSDFGGGDSGSWWSLLWRSWWWW